MVPEVGVSCHRRVPIVVGVGTASTAGPKLIWRPAVISVVDSASPPPPASPLTSRQETFPRCRDKNRSRRRKGRLDRAKMADKDDMMHSEKE